MGGRTFSIPYAEFAFDKVLLASGDMSLYLTMTRESVQTCIDSPTPGGALWLLAVMHTTFRRHAHATKPLLQSIAQARSASGASSVCIRPVRRARPAGQRARGGCAFSIAG